MMIIGAIGYTFAIGSLSSIIYSLDTRQAKFKEKLGILNKITKDHSVSPELYRRLKKVLKYDHVKNQLDEIEFLKELPQYLKLELSYKMHEDIIQKLPFFQSQPKQFIAYIGPFLKPLKILKGENIYVEGDPINDIFFIVKGRVGLIQKGFNDKVYVIVEEGIKIKQLKEITLEK